MALTILGRSPQIAKRWPHKTLNFLSNRQLRKYLAWKSKNQAVERPFNLGNALFESRRFLILLPDTLPEVLLAIPVLQSLVQDLNEVELQLLVEDRFKSFLASLYGSNSVVGLVPEEFYWGESHFLALEKKMRDFHPQLVINFRRSTPILLAYLIRMTQASLRVQILSQVEEAFENGFSAASQFAIGDELENGRFANITLKSQTPTNHLRRFLVATTLWNFSKRPIDCKWLRLKPGALHLQEAAARLAGLGLRPENTIVFLWQNPHSPFQQEILLKVWLACQRPGLLKSLVILWASGTPFSDSCPPPDSIQGIPCIEVESTGLLLGFFDLTSLAIGLNGPLLHLACLADTDVEAHFEVADAPWDTTCLNPRIRIIYRNREVKKA